MHGIPGQAYDVYLDGEKLLGDFQPATKAVVLLPAGSYQVMLVSPGAPALAANVAVDQTVTIPANRSVSLVADLSADGAAQLSTFPDDTSVLPAGDARLALYHAAGTGAVDVYVNGTKAASALSNAGYSELTLPAGSYTIEVTSAGSGVPLIGPRSVSLSDGSLDEVFAVGAPTGPSSPPRFILVAKPLAAGYHLVAGDGGIFTFGDAAFYGSMGGRHLNAPIVGMASMPVSPGVFSAAGGGYWEVASDGGIFTFGDAAFYGSMGGQHLNAPIVGMAATPDGHGYWLVASDGGIFTYGDAAFYGSMGGQHLNAPIVGMAATPDGHGYWLVASDGGIFTYGDAAFVGSLGGSAPGAPIVGMAATPDGHGYWLAGAGGAVASFGDADQWSPAAGLSPSRSIVGMIASPTGLGYVLVAADGGTFTFGDSAFYGSLGGRPLNAAITGGSL